VRVLLAIKTLGPGGAEHLLADLVGDGGDDRFEYEVAHVLADSDTLAPVIRARGVPVHSLGAASNLDWRWPGALRRLLVAGEFDVVHFHLPMTAALGRPVVATLPRDRQPVTLYTEHSLWNKVSPLVKALNAATISRDRGLIAVSDAAFGALPPRLQQRARVVVHGVDLATSRAMTEQRDVVRAAVRAELGVPPEDVLAVTVAGLRSEKGYDVLLSTARLLGDRDLPVRFAAAGGGPLERELAGRKHELGLDGRFHFLGHRDDTLALMAAADVVVLPSHQEGLPVVLMEATSVGAPIVATAVGGVPQVITDGVNGLVVPPARPNLLAAALERLVTDPGLRDRLGKQAMVDSSRFDIARARAEIEELYRQALERRS
jgi:glycosyltransferase involved in cell wall biosynthesis